MLDFLGHLFSSDFMPHGVCYQWQPSIVWLHAGSDGLIALSYYFIPFLLIYFVQRRQDLAYKWMFVMFGAFIFACGTTHLMEIWTIWNGTYRLTGAIKLVTAVVSASTAVLLVPLIPRALALPSPQTLRRVNTALEGEVRERKRSEEALRETEERFRGAFDSAPIGMALVAPDGRWMEVNRALCDILGYTEAELLDRTFQDVTHPDDLDADLQNVARIMRREIDTYQMEKRYLHRTGRVVWILLSVSAVRTRAGDVQYFVSQIQDITQRRAAAAELERTNAKLRHRNRELQDFAYVASHDLQEPLRKIQAFTGLLADDLGEVSEQLAFYMDRIQDAASRMSNLISDLLVFSRVSTQAAPYTEVDLNDVMADVRSDLYVRLEGDGVLLDVGDLPVLEADRSQMHQLMLNLVGNALKFHKEGEPARVRVTAEVEDRGAPHVEGARLCHITVEDNGIGIDEKYLDRIFFPFQRLHGAAVFEGTGMGLAICRRIVERHHGTIDARSAPGEGSTFVVTLPMDQREPQTSPSGLPGPRDSGNVVTNGGPADDATS